MMQILQTRNLKQTSKLVDFRHPFISEGKTHAILKKMTTDQSRFMEVSI